MEKQAYPLFGLPGKKFAWLHNAYSGNMKMSCAASVGYQDAFLKVFLVVFYGFFLTEALFQVLKHLEEGARIPLCRWRRPADQVRS